MMNRRWLPLNALRAFDAVGVNLSFTTGAKALGVTQSALSRHVIGLEELIGKPLLDRKPHRLTLTEAGAYLLPIVQKSFDRLEQALTTIQQDTKNSRTLRIHIPPSLLTHLAIPLLQDFHKEFPNILIDISSSHVTGLPSQSLDVAITYDKPSIDNTVTDLLWLVRVTPVCSPAVAELAKGKSLDQFLAEHELLHVKLAGEARGMLWSFFARQCNLDIDTDRGMAFDTVDSATQFAKAGAGVALADRGLFAEDLAAGTLVAPYPNVCENGYGYYLKFHAEDLSDPVIAAFRNWIIAHFSPDGDNSGGSAPAPEG